MLSTNKSNAGLTFKRRGFKGMHNRGLLLLACIFLLASSCSAETREEKPDPTRQAPNPWLSVTKVTEDDFLNMRAQPTSKSKLLLKIPHHAHNIFEISEEGKWLQVKYRGVTGWIHSKYVNYSQAHSFDKIFDQELFCLGTEPHWTLKSQGSDVTFKKYGNTESLKLNSEVVTGTNATNVWMSTFTQDEPTAELYTLVLQKTETCSDGMSNETYPMSVFLIKNNAEILSGCCK